MASRITSKEAQGSGLRAQGPGLKAQGSRLKARGSGLGARGRVSPPWLARAGATLLVAVAAVLLITPSAYAQFENAGISGRVTDPSGRVLVSAVVELKNVDTNLVATTTTNREGFYVFPALKPGKYVMNVHAASFRSVSVTGIVLNVQDNVSRNFQLAVGSRIESVTVTAEFVRAKTLDPTVSTVVDQQFVQNIPLNGRSFQPLLTLTPGVTMVGGNSWDQGQFSVNGQRTNANYFTVDGVSANFGAGSGILMGTGVSGSTPTWSITGGTSGLVSVDAMQEFRVQAASYAAEFGRTPGGQVSIVTKSGTNAFHGSAFEYFRDEALDARDYFNPPPMPKPQLSQHDFGGTVGGPIARNRTFFFASYEGLRLDQPNVSSGTLYTQKARDMVAPVWKPYVDSTPIPTGPVSADGLTARHTMAASFPVVEDAFSLRVDHTLTDRTSLFARYTYAPSTATSGALQNRMDAWSDTQAFTAGATATLAPNKLNELRVNWSRNRGGKYLYTLPLDGAVVPQESQVLPAGFSFANTQLAGTTTAFSSQWGADSDNANHQFNVVDTFSWTLGSHALKFGFDWRRLRPEPSYVPQQIGLIAGWAHLQAGTIGFAVIQGNGVNKIRVDSYSAFAQDSWRVADNLTLTYGLRWDVNPAPVSLSDVPLYAVHGVFESAGTGWSVAPAGGGLWKTRYGNVAPRLGAAYQVTPTTVLRGGVGLFYDLGGPSDLGYLVALAFPVSRYAIRLINTTYSLADPTLFIPPPITTDATGVEESIAFDPNLKTPLTYQWNVAVERELGRTGTVAASYVGSRGADMIRLDELQNASPAGSLYAVEAVSSMDTARYDALQLSYRRRMSRGLQAMLSYTLAKSQDSGSTDVTKQNALQAATTLSDIVVGLNYGYSSYDVRHTVSGAMSYAIPSPFDSGAGHAILDGWAVDGLLTVRSGLPMDIMGMYTTFNGAQQSLRPDVVPGQPFWIDDATVPKGRRLNPDAFVATPTPGNYVRNSLRNFPLRQIDLALRRRFVLGGRYTLDLRAEAFNAFNLANLQISKNPGQYLSDPRFGIADQSQNSSTGVNNIGGAQSTQYAMGGPRSWQLAARFGF